MKEIIQNLQLSFDKLLDVIGQKKTIKGFSVTAISGIILLIFPTFPKDNLDLAIQSVVQVIFFAGQAWTAIGIVHQWIKDNLLKQGIVPPSIVKLAEETGKAQILK